MNTCDVIIIGTGIAGMSLALKLIENNPEHSIIMLSKGHPCETNTSLAQGGIAAVMDRLRDNYEQHIQDTLEAGHYLNDVDVVNKVVRQAPTQILELIKWGVHFDTGPDGNLALGLEGGHQQARILHAKDKTGMQIQEVLWKQVQKAPQISIMEHAMVTDLLCSNQNGIEEITGLNYLNTNHQHHQLYAPHIVMATGGCGQIFGYTSNPEIATGDGIALAVKVGAELSDMQYIQFHPTAFYEANKSNLFLISEALRGFGAHVVNADLERFLFQYDIRGELAPRDIVSQAIFLELLHSKREHVYLDLRHLDLRTLKDQFPTICSRLEIAGFRVESDLIPIVPAAHYQCGGIKVDHLGRSSIPGLYALGECARTGLHGSNRLASNSLLEALVYAHQIAETITLQKMQPLDKRKTLTKEQNSNSVVLCPVVLRHFKNEIKQIMSFGILYGDTETLEKGLGTLIKLHQDLMECLGYYQPCKHSYELENMLITAIVVLQHSLCPEYVTSKNQS